MADSQCKKFKNGDKNQLIIFKMAAQSSNLLHLISEPKQNCCNGDQKYSALGMRGRGTAIIPVLAVVQGVVEGAEQRVPGTAADTVKVVCVDAPGHDAGKTLVVGKISLSSNANYQQNQGSKGIRQWPIKYIPNDDTQNYPLSRLKLVNE